jgi:Domain of unknown function (DUF4407)
MSILTKPLFALSKTDCQLIQLCSDTAYKTQAGYGIFVLIVGLFAFFSSSYALSTTLNVNGVYLIAAIYATLIMMIDREIVSVATKSRAMVATRLVLAVFIGLVVSVPIELRLFKPQIEQQLQIMQNSDNAVYMEEKKQAEAQYRKRILDAEKRIQDIDTEIGKLRYRRTNEVLERGQQISGVVAGTGRPGKGTVYRELETHIQEKTNELLRAQEALQSLKAGEQQEFDRIDAEYRRKAAPPADDLLSRYTALGAVKQHPTRGWDAWFMAWGVRLLLIMLELTPALIKILQEENEYDALVRATRRRSITRIYAIANDHMEQLAQNGGQNPTPTLIGQLKADPLTS